MGAISWPSTPEVSCGDVHANNACKMICALVTMIPITVALTSSHRATESIIPLKTQKSYFLLQFVQQSTSLGLFFFFLGNYFDTMTKLETD